MIKLRGWGNCLEMGKLSQIIKMSVNAIIKCPYKRQREISHRWKRKRKGGSETIEA